jgi:hypothetical protein
MIPDEDLLEFLPVGDGPGRAEQVGDLHGGQVPAGLEQFDAGIREGPDELTPPGPGSSRQGLARLDDDDVRPVHREVMPGEAVPPADDPREWLGLVGSRTVRQGEAQRDDGQIPHGPSAVRVLDCQGFTLLIT